MSSLSTTRFQTYIAPLTVLVVAWVAIAATTPRFRGVSSVYSVLNSLSLVGIVALGLAVTIIVGELDLSVGSMAAFAAVVAIKAAPWGLIPAILFAVLVGTAIGALQGFTIARLRINSLVLTIGTLILLRGLTWELSNNTSLPLKDFTVSDPLLWRGWVFSASSLVAIVLFVVVGLYLAYTRSGRQIYATGGARNEAVAAGVPRYRPITVSFALSAACASLAGALAAIRGGSAAPSNYADLLLSGAAAALLGGISLYGGRGTVLNVALGVAILGVITSGLAIRGSDAAEVQLVTGVLLLAVIALEYGIRRIRPPRRERSTPLRLGGSRTTHDVLSPASDQG